MGRTHSAHTDAMLSLLLRIAAGKCSIGSLAQLFLQALTFQKLGDCGIYDKFSAASVNDEPLGPQDKDLCKKVNASTHPGYDGCDGWGCSKKRKKGCEVY